MWQVSRINMTITLCTDGLFLSYIYVIEMLEFVCKDWNFMSTLVEWKAIWDILKRWETTSIGNQQLLLANNCRSIQWVQSHFVKFWKTEYSSHSEYRYRLLKIYEWPPMSKFYLFELFHALWLVDVYHYFHVKFYPI